ncbi:MAG: hypothetical protein KGH57_01350 [Candidatus Micrarchaeota archaeon]|nr:hypothetical protein [Candidatus Micrarchaeota archaeon]
MSTKVVSESAFRKSASELFFNNRGMARTTIELGAFENLQKDFEGLPGLGRFLVMFGNRGGEEGVEVHGLGKNNAEVYTIDRFHGELHHLLGIVGRDIDRSRMGCT